MPSCSIITSTRRSSAITSVLGGSWNSSVSIKSEITYTIPPNYYGWIKYTPIVTNSYGYMNYVRYIGPNTYTNISSEWTDIYIPKKDSNGNSDGLYECITSQSFPSY
jgi:hypothetical protein